MSQVFFGQMQDAYQTFSEDGAAALEIIGMPATLNQARPADPLSYPNGADVATVMASLANSMNLTFANYGVNVQLPKGSYYWGSAPAMAESVRKAANILMYVDPGSQTMAICPIDGKPSGVVPQIGPGAGLVGYPSLSNYGIKIKVEFNPQLSVLSVFDLDTSIVNARGMWQIITIEHSLSSITPGGPWFSMLDCARVAGDPTVPQ